MENLAKGFYVASVFGGAIFVGLDGQNRAEHLSRKAEVLINQRHEIGYGEYRRNKSGSDLEIDRLIGDADAYRLLSTVPAIAGGAVLAIFPPYRRNREE